MNIYKISEVSGPSLPLTLFTAMGKLILEKVSTNWGKTSKSILWLNLFRESEKLLKLRGMIFYVQYM